MDWLIEPFQYTFMQKALLGIVLASISCSAIGTYVVLRRIAFLGEALTHTLLPGIVFAYFRGLHLFVGALGASILTVLGIGLLSSKSSVRQDSAIGVVLTSMFALGVLMMSLVRSFRDFSTILFGSILGVTSGDLILMGSITLAIITVLILLHKELELASFDPTYARMIKARPKALRYTLLVLVALSVVSAIQMMGALLTTALVITPAAAAALVARTVSQMILLSTSIAFISGIAGLIISYYFEISSGAAIVINCTVLFSILWIIKSFRAPESAR